MPILINRLRNVSSISTNNAGDNTEIVLVRNPDFYLSPSRAGSCKRLLYFEATEGVEEDTDDPLTIQRRHIFEDGRMHEDLTISWLSSERSVSITDRQRPVNLKVPRNFQLSHLIEFCGLCQTSVPRGYLHGHIDGIYNVDNRKGLFEHKAVNDSTFNLFRRKGVSLNYLQQASLYMRGLDLTEGVIVVKNKNSANYLEVELAYNKKKDVLTVVSQSILNGSSRYVNKEYFGITMEAFKNFKAFEDYISNNQIPPREFSEHCSICPARARCEEVFFNVERPGYTHSNSLARAMPASFLDKVREYNRLKQQASAIYDRMDELKSEIITDMNTYRINSAEFSDNDASYIISHQTYRRVEEVLNKDLLKEALGDSYNQFVEEIKENVIESLKIFSVATRRQQTNIEQNGVDTEQSSTLTTRRQR